jgi:hypothetical protein
MNKLVFNLLQGLKVSTETGSLVLFLAIRSQEQLTEFSWSLFLIGNAASTLSHMLLFGLSYVLVSQNTLGHKNLLEGPTLILALVMYNVVSQLLFKVTFSFPFLKWELDRNLSGLNLPYLACLLVAVLAIYFAGTLRWEG